jgi:hypothetical protein
MKHLITTSIMILLTTFTFLLETGAAKAQSFQPYKSGVIAYHGYQFPIVPGTNEWKQLGYAQRVESLQVPSDTLNQMSTTRLLETCLYYPFNIDIIAFDDHLMGYAQIKNQFNGYSVLLSRPDFVQCLIELYNSREVSLVEQMTVDYEKGRLSFDFQLMEYLFTDAAVLASPSQSEQIAYLLVQKMDQKSLYSSIFSSVSLPITALAIGRCFQQCGFLTDSQRNTLDSFLQGKNIINNTDLLYLFDKARELFKSNSTND